MVKRSFTVDNRTSVVRVYRRKGNWPTKDNSQTGELDPSYDRGTVGARDGWLYEDGGWATNDNVYDILVAVDANGQEGESEKPSPYTVTGSASAQITSAARADVDYGTNCSTDKRSVEVSWAVAGVTTETLKVYRIVDDGPEVEIESVSDPVSTTSYQDDQAPMYYGDGLGGQSRRVDYRLDLLSGATVVDSRLLEETWSGAMWYLCVTPE
jgi:hypothetical protein